MRPARDNLEAIFEGRRRSVLRALKNLGPKGQAFLVPSAPLPQRAPDLEHTFFQDSNFYYLTGFSEPDSALLLLANTKGPRSVLFLRDRDTQAERWLGERLGLKRAKQRFRIDEVRDIKEFESSLPKLMAESHVLHYPAGLNSAIDDTIWKLFRSLSGPRINFPHTLKDARLLLSEMRFVKDRFEIGTLRHVVDITAISLLELAPQIRSIASESHAARVLEANFAKLGAHGPAFPTIVASGKNATCLHYTPRLQPLWRRELVLIDAGALFRGYAGDISRTLPVSGKFSKAQADLYQVVTRALNVTISKAKPEATLESLHQTAVKEITEGLVALKVLKGDVSQHIATETYKKFYMHRTGHFLGLDVHDIPPCYQKESDGVTSHYHRPFVAGVVLTVEPGLYFDAKDEKVPKYFRGIGIRLEEDVLITNSGHEVLSKKMPVAKDDIEQLME